MPDHWVRFEEFHKIWDSLCIKIKNFHGSAGSTMDCSSWHLWHPSPQATKLPLPLPGHPQVCFSTPFSTDMANPKIPLDPNLEIIMPSI